MQAQLWTNGIEGKEMRSTKGEEDVLHLQRSQQEIGYPSDTK